MRRVGADVLERHPRLKKVVLELLGDEFTCFVVDDVTPEHSLRRAIQFPPPSGGWEFSWHVQHLVLFQSVPNPGMMASSKYCLDASLSTSTFTESLPQPVRGLAEGSIVRGDSPSKLVMPPTTSGCP